jgi:hypothetical protein
MTDRLKGATVVFEEDIREDDAQGLIDAIKHLRGVLDVIPNIKTPNDAIIAQRIRIQLSQDLFDVLERRVD